MINLKVNIVPIHKHKWIGDWSQNWISELQEHNFGNGFLNYKKHTFGNGFLNYKKHTLGNGFLNYKKHTFGNGFLNYKNILLEMDF